MKFGIDLLPASSLANHTGAWRTKRPVYVEQRSPCDAACPAGETPRSWLGLVNEGDHRAAWEAIVAQNPLPAVTGRACYHPCRSACHRGSLDEPVSIHAVERFLGDLAFEQRWTLPACAPSTGKKVLVVGGGPAGLSAAYHLMRLGHAVTLREAAPRLGGMLRYGIPRYRLPRPVLDAEIERIVALGLRVECGRRVDDVSEARRAGDFAACFVAVGAGHARRIDIPTSDASRVIDAVGLLASVEDGSAPSLGRRVVVYGGGNTALDAARSARRLGSEDTVIVYRRTRAQMPAHDSEIEEALAEGIRVRWLRTIDRVEGDRIFIERMELDEAGRPRPTGDLEPIDASTVVLAVGQDSDLSLVSGAPAVRIADGVVGVDASMMTGEPGIFAGGDAAPGERSIAVAVGHGARGARGIDAWLTDRGVEPSVTVPIARFESLAVAYHGHSTAAVEPLLDDARRRVTFEEVHGSLPRAAAEAEAQRCMSCGHCFACDNCYAVCPDDAIAKLEAGRFRVDDDFCKGCGLCVAECPTGAMEMIAEPDVTG